ncbi:hypothetical protein CBX40_013270 [Salmonella enterica]|nr:hypothetical protein [Salmonella enterica]EDV9233444.1 hypothetical protein [Salmonella enterica subsp. arizonae]EBM6079905.1 hypothetical protein [Salmonella enterica]EEA5327636.1 hypothetical protein [Salmonella enterica]EIL6893399.1 hypothetical protein [Salmonella enterica]
MKNEQFWRKKLNELLALSESIKHDENIKYKYADCVAIPEDCETFCGESSYCNEDMTVFWYVMTTRYYDRHEKVQNLCDAFVEVDVSKGSPDITVFHLNLENIGKSYFIDSEEQAVAIMASNAVTGIHDFVCQYFDCRDDFEYRMKDEQQFLLPYVQQKVIIGYEAS